MDAHKVLTVRPEWGWAIMFGGKLVENRSWRTRHRGPLLIHAGKTSDRQAREWMAAHGLPQPPANLISGAILGQVQLVDVVTDADSPWADEGAQHWLLADPEPWPEPVPASGDMGVWTWQG